MSSKVIHRYQTKYNVIYNYSILSKVRNMKANKIWGILVMLVVLVTAVVFTSCSSDDDGDGSKDFNAQEVYYY